MRKRSVKPWVRYSKSDGSLLEVSMESKPTLLHGEGMLHIDAATAMAFMSGSDSMQAYMVSIDGTALVEKDVTRYVRTCWQLDDITDGGDDIEILSRAADGLTLRRKDKRGSAMIVYVTAEQDPNMLLSRHMLDRGHAVQRISFDATVPHSIFARQHVA